jgi:hypothetical protein
MAAVQRQAPLGTPAKSFSPFTRQDSTTNPVARLPECRYPFNKI